MESSPAPLIERFLSNWAVKGYKQHLRLLAQQGKLHSKPHVIWDKDFISFLNEIPEKGKILIGIDANAPI
eukprot:12759146-Ditylum_brightwellii.AAC.1